MDDLDITARGGVHKALIRQILSDYPQAQTAGFMRAIMALKLDYMEWMRAEADWWFPLARVVPDAFLIDRDRQEIIAFEAIDKNDINRSKMMRLIDLGQALAEDDWTLGLITYTTSGSLVYDLSLVEAFARKGWKDGAPAHRLPNGWHLLGLEHAPHNPFKESHR